MRYICEILDQISEMMSDGKISENNIKMLFTEHFVSMCIFAERYMGDDEQAKDAVCDVFCKIWKGKEKLNEVANFKAYLYLCVKNYCLDELRKRASINKLSTDYFDQLSTESYFEIESVREEIYVLLDKAIAMQPKQTQQVLKLKMKGLKNEEIAEAMGISVNSVNTLKSHGYKALRNILGHKWNLCLILFFCEYP